MRADDRLIAACEPTRPASGAEACALLFYRDTTPTAIFAGSDSVALGCYAALSDLGLEAPRDVSLVGYGNADYGRYVSPSLTTVSLPLAQAAAADLVQKAFAAPGRASVRLRPYLLQRLSSAAPRPTPRTLPRP